MDRVDNKRDYDEDEDNKYSSSPPCLKSMSSTKMKKSHHSTDDGSSDESEDKKPPAATGNSDEGEEISSHDKKWEEMFIRLKAFQEQHGHVLVPNRYAGDTQLGSWVSTQRRQYRIMNVEGPKSSSMTGERIRRLEAVGFQWSTKDPRQVPWQQRYDELVDFKNKYGHAQVPIGWEQNVQLSNWVSTQRQEYKLMQKGRSSRMNDRRIALLENVGFVWEAQRGGPRRKRRATVEVPPEAKPVEEVGPNAKHRQRTVAAKGVNLAALARSGNNSAASILEQLANTPVTVQGASNNTQNPTMSPGLSSSSNHIDANLLPRLNLAGIQGLSGAVHRSMFLPLQPLESFQQSAAQQRNNPALMDTCSPPWLGSTSALTAAGGGPDSSALAASVLASAFALSAAREATSSTTNNSSTNLSTFMSGTSASASSSARALAGLGDNSTDGLNFLLQLPAPNPTLLAALGGVQQGRGRENAEAGSDTSSEHPWYYTSNNEGECR